MRKQYTQLKFDETMVSIMTCIYIYMYMHVHTIVYIYLGKNCKKQVQYNTLKYQIHVKNWKFPLCIGAETIPIFPLWKPLSPPILTLELHEFCTITF